VNSRALFFLITAALANNGFAADVTFAREKVQLPLPERFTVTERDDERLIATFGENNAYRLEMNLARVLGDAKSPNLGYDFVEQSASLQDGTFVRSDRAVFMPRDRQVDGDGRRIMNWLIGVGGCVLEMTVTRPLTMRQDLYNALALDLNAILNGVRCATP
jgi:hypothetical protein